jgi:hypothetical protein
MKGVIEVTAFEEILGQPVEEVLGITAERFLRAVPALVARRSVDHPA